MPASWADGALVPMTCLDHRALTKAGITDPLLRESYEFCRRLLITHEGWAWVYALWALPPHKRPHAWALYGFGRWTDTIADTGDPATRATELRTWHTHVKADLRAGRSQDPIRRALLHTLRTCNIDVGTVHAYLESMRMSLTASDFPTYADLQRYIEATNVSVGRQMLALFEPLTAEAGVRMDALSTAMYLTDLIQDLGEDLRAGRLYLPQEELAAFGVSRSELERGVVVPAVRDLLRFQLARARRHYELGVEVIDMVAPSSKLAIRCGAALFKTMLDDIERRDFDVFNSPPRATAAQMVRVLGKAGLPALGARLRNHPTHPEVIMSRSPS